MMRRMLQHLSGDSRTRRRGFTLLELAVSLGVIALISGTGAVIARNALRTADRISTQEKLNIIKLALDSHAKTYGYLPCPARRDATPTGPTPTDAAQFGVEARANGSSSYVAGGACAYSGGTASVTGISLTSPAGALVGAVPVRSLGLPDSYAGDAWGNKFSYAVTYGSGIMFTQNVTNWASNTGQILVLYGSNAASFRTTTRRKTVAYSGMASGTGGVNRVTVSPTGMNVGTAVTLSGGANVKGSFLVSGTSGGWIELSGTAYAPANSSDAGNIDFLDTSGGGAVAYVVVSHGSNGSGAYAMNGTTAKGCVSGLADYENCDGDLDFYDTDYNDDADSTTKTNYFDDFLVWGNNEPARTPVNAFVYTSSGASPTRLCPTGVCEPWCASCDHNYPASIGGSNTSATPASLNGTIFGLCRKVITTNSTTCAAACFWTGRDSNPSFYRCP